MKHIELVEISKSYDGKNKVIDKISVQVEKGEFFVRLKKVNSLYL